MRKGMRVFDADTHGGPNAELLEPYLESMIRERIPDLDAHKRPIKIGLAGEKREEPYKHNFSFGQGGGWGRDAARWLGEAGPRDNAERSFQKFMGTRFPTEGGVWDSDIRIKDMDVEGVDAQLVVTSAVSHPDPEYGLRWDTLFIPVIRTQVGTSMYVKAPGLPAGVDVALALFSARSGVVPFLEGEGSDATGHWTDRD